VPDPINPISIVDGDTHINKYPGKKIYIGGNEYLPVGTVLMYNGSGIADAGSRSTPLGAEQGDTIDMPGWYVCNGNASTPNLLNRFIRAESASGNTGGSDNQVILDHTHNTNINHGHQLRTHGGTGNGVANHLATYHGGANAMCDHYHQITYSSVYTGGGTKGSGNPNQTSYPSGSGRNKPAYYSLIFIIRMT
jgi:hypothetical protein